MLLRSIHPFNKLQRHFECLINDVIRGELSAAILNDLITPHRTMSTEETKVSLNCCIPFLLF